MRELACLAVALSLLGGCLLTDPPGDRPAASTRRPAIVHEALDPPVSQVLTAVTRETTLRITVEAEPEVQLVWRMFVDFNPQLSGAAVSEGTIPADPKNLAPTRVVDVPIYGFFDDTQCHTLEVIVAQSFSTKSAWTPNSPGGDSAVWFFRPGDPAGACPGLDAGSFADAAAFDAGAE